MSERQPTCGESAAIVGVTPAAVLGPRLELQDSGAPGFAPWLQVKRDATPGGFRLLSFRYNILQLVLYRDWSPRALHERVPSITAPRPRVRSGAQCRASDRGAATQAASSLRMVRGKSSPARRRSSMRLVLMPKGVLKRSRFPPSSISKPYWPASATAALSASPSSTIA